MTEPGSSGRPAATRSLGAQATSGMGWALVERWGSQLLASGVFVVLARLIAPKAFGVVALASVFVAFANVFVGQGFAQAIIKQRPLRKDHIDTAFWTNATMGFLLAALGIGLAPLIAHAQGNSDVRPVLQALSLDFLLGALGGIPEAMLQRELRFRQLSVRTLVSNVIADVIGIALAVRGAGVWALVAQTLAQTAIDTLILWAVTPQRPGLSVTKAAFGDMRDFGLNVTGLNVLNLMNRQSDNFLIGIYLGATKLGFYSVAYQVLNLFEDAFVNTTQVVMFPVFSSVAHDRKRLDRAYEMASRATAMLAIPAFTGLSLVTGQMIPLVFGDKWDSAVPVAEVLAFIGIIHAVTQFNGQVCKAVGMAGIVLRFSALNTAVNVAAFFVAVHYGIFWVAVAYVARGWLLYPLSVTMVRAAIHHDVRRHLLGFAAPIVSTLIMAAAVGGFEVSTVSWPAWPRLLLSVVIGIAAYLGTLLLTSRRQIEELASSIRSARREGPRRPGRGGRAMAATVMAEPTDAVFTAPLPFEPLPFEPLPFEPLPFEPLPYEPPSIESLDIEPLPSELLPSELRPSELAAIEVPRPDLLTAQLLLAGLLDETATARDAADGDALNPTEAAAVAEHSPRHRAPRRRRWRA